MLSQTSGRWCFFSPPGGKSVTLHRKRREGDIAMVNHLVWIDLEMSGLDPEQHVIVEIASIVTDAQLNVVAEGPDLAIHHSKEVLAAMDEWSRKHHGTSGLLRRMETSTCSCARAEQETLAFLSQYTKKGKSPLCGNSICQDRRFLIKHMPELETHFHYRNIDVSSIKELVKRWYPGMAPFQKRKDHLALSDIRESIDELRYYRRHVFVR